VSLIDDAIKEPEPPEPFMRPRWPLRLIAGLLLILGTYAFWYEPATLRAVQYPIRIEGGIGTTLRIAVISDLHGGAPYINEEKIRQVVALANGARPDLILLTGDYVVTDVLGGWHMPIESIAGQLRALRAPLGVYAVLGNHDRWGDTLRIERALNAAGIAVLEDRAARIGLRGHTFYLAGISDYNTGPHVVGGAMLGIPVGQKALCFTHSPDVFPELPRTCILTIAGHTHGGQVALPFLGRLIVPSRYGERYAIGMIHEDGKYLFVSSGIGTSILPVRFDVRPEVTILDVR
jgi:predicted MPP superfamily phosphohydrolase